MKLKNYMPAMIVVILFFLLWELIVRAFHVSSSILPAPSLIVGYSTPYLDVIASHSLQTLVEALTGLIVAVIMGVTTALALDLSPTVRKALYPLLVSSQTIPIIALAPLLLVWLGYGLLPKVIVVALYCFFPISLAMAAGLASVNLQQINLFKTMKATHWQLLKFVSIPTALPSFFAGLKIAVAYSMTGAIVSEYIGASKGLGIFIQTSANAHAIPLVFAAIFAAAVISLVLFASAGWLERKMAPWRFS